MSARDKDLLFNRTKKAHIFILNNNIEIVILFHKFLNIFRCKNPSRERRINIMLLRRNDPFLETPIALFKLKDYVFTMFL